MVLVILNITIERRRRKIIMRRLKLTDNQPVEYK